MNNHQRIEEEDKSNRFIIIPLMFLIFVFFIAFALILFFINRGEISHVNPNNDNEPSTEVDNQKRYNKLLEILNKKIKETSLLTNEKVEYVTSFIYKEQSFHIASFNNDFVYDLSLDLSGVNNINNEVDAYNYIISDETTTYQMNYIDRYDIYSSKEFESVYLTDSYSYKYVSGSLGESTFVYMTRMDKTSKEISIICGDNISMTLTSGYKMKRIDESHQLYSIYRFIADYTI